MKRSGGLRRRWLINTAGVVSILGLVCVLAISAVSAVYYYSGMESDLRARAKATTAFFSEDSQLDSEKLYEACAEYVASFEGKDDLELQFISAESDQVISSYSQWEGEAPATPEIRRSITTRGPEVYIGSASYTAERIMAVSAPMICGNGEVIGVLRYVTSTRLMDRQVITVAIVALMAVLIIEVVVLASSSYYIHSILTPMAEITDKAKRIAGGTYGIQIQNKYPGEIGELADTINEMSVKINQNEIMQTEFISSLSHELRTPLTAITGWSETLLSSETLDADTQRGMKIILREARRLTEMVLDLLDFTRIQDGRMTLNVEPADIRAEFEDTVYMYSSRLSQDGIDLVYLDNDEDIPEIPCDPKRLRQVFLNILDNAAKHGREGGRIEASMHYENEHVVVCIRDFGPGIAEDELPLVKRKFYKGSSKARGNGIGLAVCDEIVQMHGGELLLDNAPDGGTLVTVTLPAAQ